MDIKLFVAAHKACPLPNHSYYVPLQVGAVGKAPITYEECGITYAKGNILRDDSGENISQKNPYYCELTGVYYIWKNVDADVVGLCHYRRYFTLKKGTRKDEYNPYQDILNLTDIEKLMSQADVIVPKRNKFFIETLYSHYAHTHDSMHLDIARELVAKNSPEYLKYVDAVFSRTNGSMYNMIIVKKDLFDEYCQWVFKILELMEPTIDLSELSDFQARLFGRVSELLLNAWLLKKEEEGLRIEMVPVVYNAKINWVKKIIWFLQAKFFGKKYTRSA